MEARKGALLQHLQREVMVISRHCSSALVVGSSNKQSILTPSVHDEVVCGLTKTINNTLNPFSLLCTSSDHPLNDCQSSL